MVGLRTREVRSAPPLMRDAPPDPRHRRAAKVPTRALREPPPTACAPQVSSPTAETSPPGAVRDARCEDMPSLLKSVDSSDWSDTDDESQADSGLPPSTSVHVFPNHGKMLVRARRPLDPRPAAPSASRPRPLLIPSGQGDTDFGIAISVDTS